jgi:hypothetical protein
MSRTPVSHRAMLVSLNQRAWKGSATDREVAAQAELSAGAEMGTMTVIKQLTPKYLIQPINTIKTLGRQEHYKLTVPGLFRGQALLPTKLFETYMLGQGEIKEQFFAAVDKFVAVYPEVREKARHQLGTSFKERDFPSSTAIKGFFDYQIQAAPVPEVSDWRLDGVTEQDISELRGEVEDSVKSMYAEATKTMFNRAKEMLESIARQAKNYSTDAPGAMLRDATIEQMKDIASLVCDMNITNDPLLDRIGKEMLRDFADIQGTELRKSADLRKDIASKAQKILNKMVPVKRVAA